MIVREISAIDEDEWLRKRKILWPDCPIDQHQAEMQDIQQHSSRWTVGVLDRGNGNLGGFIEVSLREHVDGVAMSPVAYVEGWYVDDDLRQQGAGRELLQYAENWARSHELTEIASDADLSNADSIAAHRACEFRETARIVQFVKRLT